MKLCVIAPKETYLVQAGVRIRYQRIAEHLAALGHSLAIEVIDELRSAADLQHDVYLFSKVYDARSYVIARQLSRAGKLMGVDLFDDYFSQGADSRFTAQRRWLRTMGTWCGYVLCSTPRMKAVARDFMPGVPVHILNDPYDQIDYDHIADELDRKLDATLAQQRIDVAWFGNGDNPHFSVGLKDVQAFGMVLTRLAQGGLKVRLRMLTNRRAMGADGLEALGRLSVPWTLDEWSLAGEQDLLRGSLVAFIPVNAQAFSAAKSLNRAVSALSSATQVLSAGYPLYEPLADFLYRRPADLLADIRSRQLRMRRETMPALAARFAEWADPAGEAQRLAAFLAAILEAEPAYEAAAAASADAASDEMGMGIVHGARSGADVHQLAQRHGYLSIGSPYAHESLHYDVRLWAGTDECPFAVEMEERALSRLREDLRPLLQQGPPRKGRAIWLLPLAEAFPAQAEVLARAVASRKSRLGGYATYAAAMAAMFELVEAMYPGIQLLLSESEAPHGAAIGAVRAHAPARAREVAA
jgi:hypothetical protein